VVKISPFVKLLRGEYELTVILLLARLKGRARADEIIKKGLETKTLPALNGARVAGVRKFLSDNGLIEIEKEGKEIIHILTKRGQKLGTLLNSISDFIVKDLKWER
jgi:predicted transcriptional regulator